MTQKVLYVADDGTEFEYEDDCLEYEIAEELIPLFQQVQLWDCRKDPIPTPTDWASVETALSEMHYARGAVEALIDAVYGNDLEDRMFDYRSFRDEVGNANDNDLLMFDGDMDCWVNVNYLFDKYRKILKMFGDRG